MALWRRHAVAGAALLAAVPLLAGCGALGNLGAGSHNPPAKQFTVTARVTSLVIHGGTGSIDVTGTSGSAVTVSQQATYSSTLPAASHELRGTTLTISYTCPSELVCGVSYDVKVPRDVAVSASATAGSVTLTSLAGPVSARASAGLITAVDLRCGVASFSANAGGVIATFATVVGTSTVTVRRGGSGHSISAHSDLGSISVSPA